MNDVVDLMVDYTQTVPDAMGFLCDKEWLKKTYVDDGRTLQQIASMLGCTTSTVSRYLDMNDIPSRRPGRRVGTKQVLSQTELINHPYKDPKWLYAEHFTKGRSLSDIGKQFGISRQAVHQYVIKIPDSFFVNQERLCDKQS